ncbi:hypothetical protein [Mycobacterium sp. 3519A]|jgi:hypothetical protein|uniref:hypothetical protein n=1 Tax=Mycobacterium sp. 3519A TaxID=2057184 RepID=UPI000C7CD05E|nr:hypothetical protein [Mycobacterium sp. 3519A]
MSIAAPIDAIDIGDPPRADAVEHGVVAVRNYGFGRSEAACSCGWAGRRRYLKAAAEQDAWMHSVHQRCDIAVPLVIPFPAA